ncbi:MAG: phosphotransferase family protein [Acidimicrobiia bacterium]
MAEAVLLDPERLEQYLTADASHLGVRHVHSIERFTNGLSSLSCRVGVETDSGPATWVLRAEPDHGVIPPYDIAWESRLLARVGKAGLPVPGLVHVETDEHALGHRFALMTYVDGEVYRSLDTRFDDDPALKKSVQTRFVEMLARIHQTQDHGLAGFDDGPSSARALVAVCRRRLADTEIMPKPLLRHALDVLDRLAPECERLVLLHGDYRLPNLKWRDGEIVGVLDWELARVGDPVSDLAFTQTVGAGPCAVENELAEYYCELTGETVDERRIVYYQTLELLKSSIIGLAGAHDVVTGGTDLRLLSVAALGATAEPIVAMLESQLELAEEMNT